MQQEEKEQKRASKKSIEEKMKRAIKGREESKSRMCMLNSLNKT